MRTFGGKSGDFLPVFTCFSPFLPVFTQFLKKRQYHYAFVSPLGTPISRLAPVVPQVPRAVPGATEFEPFGLL